jgi:hypothetical protein
MVRALTTGPTVIFGDQDGGAHNSDLARSIERLSRAKTYRDLSTICVVPTRGKIAARVVERWMGLMAPMNQKFIRLFIEKMEVGAAYNAAIDLILNHPDLSQWPYVLTLEEDNIPPVDGLLRLYESIDDYAAVGGLYWTKGEEGQPMIYGAPHGMLNFVPQVPQVDTVQECNGLGMGFTLFRTDLFRSMEPPWFETIQEVTPGGMRAYTQDLHFFERVRKAGNRVACDTRVKVGHYDADTGMIW